MVIYHLARSRLVAVKGLICQFQLIFQCLIGERSTMERLTILVGRLYKSVGPTKYFFKVKLVGRFMALVGGISGPVESPLQCESTVKVLKFSVNCVPNIT